VFLSAVRTKVTDRLQVLVLRKADAEFNQKRHDILSKNWPLIRELCGSPENHQFIASAGLSTSFSCVHPDDADVAQKLEDFWTEEQRKDKAKLTLNRNCAEWIIGGPTGNPKAAEAYGFDIARKHDGVHFDHSSTIGNRWVSVVDTNSDLYREKYTVKHYLPKAKEGEKTLIDEQNAWIWRDTRPEDPKDPKHIRARVDADGFQLSDYLKLTRIGNDLIIDGLHGLGTRTFVDLLQNRGLLEYTIHRFQKQYNIDYIENESFEAIFRVDVKHDHNKQISTPENMRLKEIHRFAPNIRRPT
jgi:hypothetical protein